MQNFLIEQQQINLSIISPKYSSDFIKLYEKVNRSNGEFKLEKINNITYFTLLHKSIHLGEKNRAFQSYKIIDLNSQFNFFRKL